jgi:hypothetical protein
MTLSQPSGKRQIVLHFLSASLIAVLLFAASAAPPASAQTEPPAESGTGRAAPQAESQCFYPVADTYVAYEQFVPGTANTNYGGEQSLVAQLTDASSTIKRIYLRFDVSPIPTDATILSADLELYLTQATAGATYYLNRATGPWQEYGLTYNNQPGYGGGFDSPFHSATAGRKTWNATQPVSDWVSGVFNNYGFVIASGILEAPTSFASHEGSIDQAPRLCVEWTTSEVNIDLQVTGLEVTQAVQDLNNSVRLVVGKPTYVRLHARSVQGDYRTFASLAITCDGFGRVLYPVNPGTNGYIVVRETPDRSVQNHAFLFLLPSDCTDEAEQIRLSGLVNTVTSWRGEYPPEDNVGNNWSGEYFIDFESVPQLDTIVYLADYEISGGGSFSTSVTDAYMLRSWLQRAYPIAETTMILRTIDFGQATVNITGTMTSPNSDDFNAELAAKRDWDLAHDNWYESITGGERHIRYYGMIDDSGGFMRGASADIPSTVASGPTGDGRFTWDTDGSFGDWYGGHELGHTLGRMHVNCRGDEVGPDPLYPHTNGLISTSQTGDDAFFGFDSGDLVDGIYGPNWSDVMSYCSWQWISDYTTHGILDYMQTNFATSRAAATAGSHLQVVGTINAHSGATQLKPLFVLPDAIDVEAPVPGAYAIVLRNSGGSELVRYSFTPVPMDPGPPSPEAPRALEPAKLLISEMVPFVNGTDEVLIEGPSGVLAQVSAGSAAPAVTVVSPNGGENVTGDPVTVSWNASDPDAGDELAFSVEFSPDNGATWELVAHGIRGNQVNIPRQNLLSTDYMGLFRVWASDGIHTASDTSNSGFRIPTRAPELIVVSPPDGLVIAQQQSLRLQAIAYSDIAGVMDGDQIRWVSVAKDGVLGFGADLTVTGLSLGTHTITVLADDGERFSSELFQVTVVADPSLLPPAEEALSVAPSRIALHPDAGLTSAQVNIDNASGTNPLNWQALNFTSWIQLERTAGTTSDRITISVDPAGLEPGAYSANVGFLTPDIQGGSPEYVQVSFVIPPEPFQVFLPLVVRQ